MNLKKLKELEETKKLIKSKRNKLLLNMVTCNQVLDLQLLLCLVLILMISEPQECIPNQHHIKCQNKLMKKIILLLLSMMIQVVDWKVYKYKNFLKKQKKLLLMKIKKKAKLLRVKWTWQVVKAVLWVLAIIWCKEPQIPKCINHKWVDKILILEHTQKKTYWL